MHNFATHQLAGLTTPDHRDVIARRPDFFFFTRSRSDNLDVLAAIDTSAFDCFQIVFSSRTTALPLHWDSTCTYNGIQTQG